MCCRMTCWEKPVVKTDSCATTFLVEITLALQVPTPCALENSSRMISSLPRFGPKQGHFTDAWVHSRSCLSVLVPLSCMKVLIFVVRRLFSETHTAHLAP